MSQHDADVPAIPIPKAKEPLNLLTGVFLKSDYHLNNDLSKCVVTGIFKNRNNSLGILFKGRKGCVYWSYDAFCHLAIRFNDVTIALEGKNQYSFKVDTGENIRVNMIIGNQYAYVSDGEHSITLNQNEWCMFINNLPLIYTSLRELFYNEDVIRTFIDRVISGAEEEEEGTDQLPSLIAERLFNEVSLYKRWPNGVCSS
jgi:hypothetical protein